MKKGDAGDERKQQAERVAALFDLDPQDEVFVAAMHDNLTNALARLGQAAARPLAACGHPCPGCRSARVPGGSSPAAADRQSHQAAMCADKSRASISP